ncbi:MFS transporter [Streptomyces alkaliterrae]|uniref:MFS transporter n=1 Tax=Streptomyces alkaliterrae TaxID=2213162 RepID=A0A5P0YWN9_9ACTN|nr:MFS transporter [Streptomyces alkaliterrae]MBB1259396.1 MFS transporter [Streptomyces alkaliterrae]MQS04703.1 MFS transporter [Streptomyces alkaliterrae]
MGAQLRRIQLGNALSAFGSGFTVPYLFVYVANVRELGAGTAGAVLAAFAAAALFVLPFVGRVIDRRGPLPVALAGTAAAAVGALGFGLSGTTSTVMASAALMGAGIAVLQPGLATMIVWCSSTATRARAFATQFFLNNLGMGLGGLLGGQLVDEHRASSFTLLFSVEAAMFLVLAGVLLTVRLPRTVGAEQVLIEAAGDAKGTSSTGRGSGDGWRRLLADRPMVLLCVLGFVLFFACYGQFESGLAAYGVEVTGISTSTLGLALFANTAMIVLTQFVVLRLVDGRRRSRVIALVGLIWTVAWLAAGISGLVPHAQAVATALLIATYALFGVGEAMLSPTVAPLVADLAPARMVGQYNSAFALVKQLGVSVGPAVGGLMAAQGAYAAYIVLLTGCSLGVTGLALLLGRRLRPEQDNPRLRTSRVVRRGGDGAAECEERAEDEGRPGPRETAAVASTTAVAPLG